MVRVAREHGFQVQAGRAALPRCLNRSVLEQTVQRPLDLDGEMGGGGGGSSKATAQVSGCGQSLLRIQYSYVTGTMEFLLSAHSRSKNQ